MAGTRSHTSTGNIAATNGLLNVAIETKGLDEMIERLQKYAKIGDTDAKRVRGGMNKTVALVFGGAQQSVPYRTGALKGSLFKKTKVFGEGNAIGNVGSSWSGAGKKAPTRWIPFTLEGGRQANRKGNMAITPRRWLFHAYSRVKGEVDAIWVQVLNLITKDLAGK
jgi:hypothetical protein